MADQTTVTTSKQFTLNLNDFWKGLLVAVLTTPITLLMASLNAGKLDFDWKAIGIAALTGLVAYLVKNFLTPSQTIVKPAPDPGTTITVPPPGDSSKPQP